MSQQGKSTPKMRRALTPRIKSDRFAGIDLNKNFYYTDKKVEPRNLMK